MNEIESTLSLSDKYQSALIGYLVEDVEVLLSCSMYLKKNNFQNIYQGEIFSIAVDFYSRHTVLPKKNDIIQVLFEKFPKEQDLAPYTKTLDMSLLDAKTTSLHPLKSKLNDFISMERVKANLKSAEKHINRGDVNKTLEVLNQAVNSKVTVEDPLKGYDQSLIDLDLDKLDTSSLENCTIGHPDFDELLFATARIQTPSNPFSIKDSTRGSLVRGELTTIMGPSNSGKTTTSATIAVANRLLGKNVLIVSHEEKESKVAIKCLQVTAKLTTTQLIHDRKIPLIQNKIEAFKKIIMGSEKDQNEGLVIKEISDPLGMYIEDVIPWIIQKNEQYKRTYGKTFDLIIWDYPSALDSREKKMEKKPDRLAHIFRSVKSLAKKLDCHIIAFAQTNRSGFAYNAQNDSNNYLSGDAVGDSFAIYQISDNFITINRNKNDKIGGRVKFYVGKSRSNVTESVFISKSDYGRSKVYGLDLPSITVNHSARLSVQTLNRFLCETEPDDETMLGYMQTHVAMTEAISQKVTDLGEITMETLASMNIGSQFGKAAEMMAKGEFVQVPRTAIEKAQEAVKDVLHGKR
jgi:replicative DNA helicase